MQHMPGRVEKRMAWWEERDGPTLRMCSRAETQPLANIARIPVANSTGVSTTSPSTAAVVASACTAATVGTFKAIVDHGRGVAVASLLAVVCCSTKCWYQRSRTSRAVAVAFDFASASPRLRDGVAFGSAFGVAFGNTAVSKPRSA
jgi:hypothetical protein